MTEVFPGIIEFLLVTAGVAAASIWALAKKGSVKLFLLILGAFVAWLVLPSVILQIKWGYYQEDGLQMGSLTRTAFNPESPHWAKQDGPLVAQVCGDAEGFDVDDPTLQWITMPEQAVVEHFFFYSKYSNVIWLGVGWKDRFCLSRYLAVQRREGYVHPLPRQLFPYPIFLWLRSAHPVEQRLIERLPPAPKAPEGVRSLLPGQCVTGEIAKGDTVRFRVHMPYFGQKTRLLFRDWDCDHKETPLALEWAKNGQRIEGNSDVSGHAGVYQVELHSPADVVRHYQLGLFWGAEPDCGSFPWRQDCPDRDLERYRQSLEREDK